MKNTIKIAMITVGVWVFVFTTLLSLYLPILMSEFINSFETSTIKMASIVKYLFIIVIIFPLSIAVKYFFVTLSWTYTNHLRKQFVSGLLGYDAYFYNTYSLGNLEEYFEVDINKIQFMISVALPNLLRSLIIIAVVFYVFIIESVMMFCFFIFIIVSNVWITKKYSKKHAHVIAKESHYHEQMNGVTSEWLDMKLSISILGRKSDVTNTFKRKLDRWLQLNMNATTFYYALWCISLLLNTFVDSSVFLFAGSLYFNGTIALGTVYLYYTYGKKVGAPLENLQQQYQSSVKGFQSIQRINKIIGYKNKVKSGSVNMDRTIHHMQIKNLNFSYGNKKILNGIFLDLKIGQSVGFFGASGDGKTTLCKILAKEIAIDDDTVFMNGVDINAIERKSYYESMAYTSNDPFVIDASIYDNIALFDKELRYEMVQQIVQELQLEVFFEDVRDRKCSVLDISCNSLSKGEKQIVALLRLFFTKKSILIIDEGVSEIEEGKAKLLLALLRQKLAKSMFIIVSHNYVLLEACTYTYQVKEGTLYEVS